MNFFKTESDIDGCFVFCYKKNEDDRGDFSRLVCREDLLEMGVDFDIKQSSLAFNKSKNTARGLHFQNEPYGENKIIACVSGSIDVFVIDLRDSSVCFNKIHERTIITKRLNASVSFREMVYVPKYCASGYITLEDNSYVLYYMDEYYHPESARVISLLQEGIDIPHNFRDATMSKKDSEATK